MADSGTAVKPPEPESVNIPMEETICNGGTQEPSLLTNLKKVENHITEAQRFSHLPKRSAVDLEFTELSYTIREGPCWRKRGTVTYTTLSVDDPQTNRCMGQEIFLATCRDQEKLWTLVMAWN